MSLKWLLYNLQLDGITDTDFKISLCIWPIRKEIVSSMCNNNHKIHLSQAIGHGFLFMPWQCTILDCSMSYWKYWKSQRARLWQCKLLATVVWYLPDIFCFVEFEEHGSTTDQPESPTTMDADNLTDSNFQVFYSCCLVIFSNSKLLLADVFFGLEC